MSKFQHMHDFRTIPGKRVGPMMYIRVMSEIVKSLSVDWVFREELHDSRRRVIQSYFV